METSLEHRRLWQQETDMLKWFRTFEATTQGKAFKAWAVHDGDGFVLRDTGLHHGGNGYKVALWETRKEAWTYERQHSATCKVVKVKVTIEAM